MDSNITKKQPPEVFKVFRKIHRKTPVNFAKKPFFTEYFWTTTSNNCKLSVTEL